jgi:hypothetical protein
VEHRLVQHLVVWHGARPRIISMSAEALGDGAEGLPVARRQMQTATRWRTGMADWQRRAWSPIRNVRRKSSFG